MSTSLDDLLVGGNKSAKFPTVGTTYSGKVTSVETRQATNFDTGKPEFWDDGTPKMQAVISVQTTERENAEDDGVRSIYIKMWGDQKKALIRASQEAGGSPAVGDTFTATYYADGEKPQRGFAPKLFKYTIAKGAPLDDQLGVQTQSNTPAPQASPSAAAETQIAALVSKGLSNEQIARVVDGVTEQDVETIRLVQAAQTGGGF